MNELKTQRYNREAQQRARGGKRSYKTEAENLAILLLWEAAELSEGQVAKLLGVYRMDARIMRENALVEGRRLADALEKSR